MQDFFPGFILVQSLTFDSFVQFFKGLNIAPDQKKTIRKAFHTYYDAVAELLQSEHTVRSSQELGSFSCIFFFSFIFLTCFSLTVVLVIYSSTVTSSNGAWKCKDFECKRRAKWWKYVLLWETAEVLWPSVPLCLLVSCKLLLYHYYFTYCCCY